MFGNIEKIFRFFLSLGSKSARPQQESGRKLLESQTVDVQVVREEIPQPKFGPFLHVPLEVRFRLRSGFPGGKTELPARAEGMLGDKYILRRFHRDGRPIGRKTFLRPKGEVSFALAAH